MKVMISYAHKDNKKGGPWAKRQLKSLGHTVVLLDVEKFVPGVHFDESMVKHVENCDVLLALLTPEYNNSSNTIFETRLARGNNKLIVPAMMINTHTPSTIESGLLRIDLTDPLERDKELLEGMKKVEEFVHGKTKSPKKTSKTKQTSKAKAKFSQTGPLSDLDKRKHEKDLFEELKKASKVEAKIIDQNSNLKAILTITKDEIGIEIFKFGNSQGTFDYHLATPNSVFGSGIVKGIKGSNSMSGQYKAVDSPTGVIFSSMHSFGGNMTWKKVIDEIWDDVKRSADIEKFLQ